MTKKILHSIYFIILISQSNIIYSQKNARQLYIDKYKYIAIKNMREFKIPASIILAQACLESNNGKSELAKKSNNHFGIKCHSKWTGKKVYHDDDKKKECFRAYKNPIESFKDHAKFLENPRYSKCFELKITDYQNWAKELIKSGYATNPKYSDLLIKIIKENKLYQYDEIALNNKKTRKQKNTNHNKSFYLDEKTDILISKNNIKYILAKEGQTPKDIANIYEMGILQILKYNNVPLKKKFNEGEIIYLQPKRNKGKKEFYIVENEKETLLEISQKLGIKLNSLRRKNRFKEKNLILNKGTKLYLQKKIKK